MTKAKRLIEIKKELRKVKKRMHLYNSNMKNNEYFCKSIEDYCFPKYVTDYEIITKDRIRYIISNITPKFPEIDFKNIIYVNKENEVAVGMTGTFKPRIFDRVEFIENQVLPLII